jgi:hypothetical protein
MAVSLSGKKKKGAKIKAIKSIADAFASEAGEESKLGGILSILNPFANMATKGALALLGIGSGGLLTPLLMGAGSSLLKKWTEEGLRKHAGMGADPSKIKSESKYGFGKKEAKEYRRGMEEGIEERGFTPESLLADVGMSYVSSLTPKTVVENGTIKLEGGDLASAQKGKGFKNLLSAERLFGMTDEGLIPEGLANIRHSKKIAEMDKLYGGDTTEIFKNVVFGEGVEGTPLSIEDIIKKEHETSLSGLLEEEYKLPAIEGEYVDFDPSQLLPKDILSQEEFGTGLSPEEELYYSAEPDFSSSTFLQGLQLPQSDLQREMKLRGRYGFQQGGQVPQYKGGGTIAEYFDTKGVSLGGSNKQSLAEMLGRK